MAINVKSSTIYLLMFMYQRILYRLELSIGILKVAERVELNFGLLVNRDKTNQLKFYMIDKY